MLPHLRLRPPTTWNEMVLSMLSNVCLKGASSAENKHVVGDMSAAKQPSLGLGRKLGAVVADDLSALVFGNRTSNSGTCM